jgi:hypothetical protein
MFTSKLLYTTLLALAASTGGNAAENKVTEGAKNVGHAVGAAAREVGHGTKKATKEIGHAVAEATRATGHAFRDGAKEVKKAATHAGGTTKRTEPKK